MGNWLGLWESLGCVCLASLNGTGLDWTTVPCLVGAGTKLSGTKGDSFRLESSLEGLSETPQNEADC